MRGPVVPLDDRTTLRYRASTRTYRLLWRASVRRTGCGLLTLTLDDGTEHQVAFRFSGR